MRAQFAIAQLQDRRGKVGRHAERARVVVARSHGHYAQVRARGGIDLHKPAGDLVDHAVSAQGKNGVKAFGLAGELDGVACMFRTDKRERIGFMGVERAEALHALGYATCGS